MMNTLFIYATACCVSSLTVNLIMKSYLGLYFKVKAIIKIIAKVISELITLCSNDYCIKKYGVPFEKIDFTFKRPSRSTSQSNGRSPSDSQIHVLQLLSEMFLCKAYSLAAITPYPCFFTTSNSLDFTTFPI